jgi:sugar lactone lactonase YvrE
VVAGDSTPLIADVQPPQATNAKVTWSSSNPAIAVVSADGIVTGVAAGSATITVATVDGGFKASVPATVTARPLPLHNVNVQVSGLNGSKIVLLNNASDRLELTANGSFTFTNKTIDYSVTVQDQPQGFQYCKVGNGSGAATSDVTVSVSCAAGKPQVTPLAGSNNSGDKDGAGASAAFRHPTSMVLDADSNLYVSDSNNNKIRKITPAGVVSTLAGSGVSGRVDGTGSGANFGRPESIALDPKSNNLYVNEWDSKQIRIVTLGGVVSTFAKSPTGYSSLTGLAFNAGGEMYASGFVDIYKVSRDGKYGSFVSGDVAPFNYISDIASDSGGNIYVVDKKNNIIIRISPAGVATIIAGSKYSSGLIDGKGDIARFNYPTGVAVDSSGSVYVADTGNLSIRKIAPDGVMSTVYTLPDDRGYGKSIDEYIAVDKVGNLYLSVQHAVLKIAPGP